MSAFGAKQGGKDSAKESSPKKGHNSSTGDAPSGDVKMGYAPKGTRGSRKGFGA